MARKPINLEAMLEEEGIQRDLQEVKYVESDAVQDLPIEAGAPDPALVDEPQTIISQEPVEVAGGKMDIFTDIMRGVGKRIEEAEKRATPRLDEAEPVEQRGEDIVVRKASDQEEAELATTLGVSKKYTKGLNLPAIAEAAKDINMAAYLQKIKDDNAELFEATRRGTISYENLLKMAEEKGVDNIVREFIRPGRKSAMRAEDILAGLIGAQELSKRTRQLAERAMKMPAGDEKQQAFEMAHNAARAEVTLYANISGEVSESARSVFAMREAQRTGIMTTRGDELDALFANQDLDTYERFFEAYLAIPEGPGKAKFMNRTIYDRGVDFLAESFINSILSSPVTHMVNMGGNASFSILRAAEEATAATFGLARSAVTGNKDRVYYRDALVQLNALFAGFTDAAIVSAKSFKRGEPLSDGSKLDTRNRRAIGTTDDFGQVLDMYKRGDMGAAFVNTFGIYNRMSMRFLTAEDEFFKAIQYQAEIKKQAYHRALSAYDVAIQNGKPADVAKREMGEAYAHTIENPPKPMRKDASDIAKEVTFQAEMGKVGSQIAPLMSRPETKLLAIPFYKTPTNVVKETFKRSPFAAGHVFYTAMKKGGREADLAFGRFATGTGVMSLFAMYSVGHNTPENDVIITGSPLNDPEAEQARMRLGIYPFSISIKRGDGSGLYDSYTYSRFDPLSGILAMSADVAYYSQYTDNPDDVADLFAHGGLAAFEYALEMPFLQGASELASVLTGPDVENKGMRLLEMGFQRATEAGISTLPTVSSLAAGIERVQEPEITETRLISEQFGDPRTMNVAQRGFYAALQRSMSRNPFFNANLPPRLNLWGQPMMAGKGVGWEAISPIRITEAKYRGIDKELVRLGDGISMPDKKMGRVLLSAEEYNRLVLLMNMDNSERVPGDEGYDESEGMLADLNDTINRPYYIRLQYDSEKIDELRSIVSARLSDAKEILLLENPDLAAEIEAKRKK